MGLTGNALLERLWEDGRVSMGEVCSWQKADSEAQSRHAGSNEDDQETDKRLID